MTTMRPAQRKYLPRVFPRLTTLLILLMFLGLPGVQRAWALAPNCTLPKENRETFRLPPLHEPLGSFSVDSPGELTTEHNKILDKVVAHLICAARQPERELRDFRLLVLAGSDDRAAREAWVKPMLESGRSRGEAQALANLFVNYIASQTRREVIVRALRERLVRAFMDEPSLLTVDDEPSNFEERAKSAAIEVVPQLLSFEAELPSATGDRRTRHPRDFAVVLSLTRSAAQSGAPKHNTITVKLPPQSEPPSEPLHPSKTKARALNLNLGGVYLRAFQEDHFGPELLVSWQSSWRLRGRLDDDHGGFVFGVRMNTFFGDRAYAISSRTTLNALPAIQGVVGLWLGSERVEGRLRLAIGGILPTVGALLQIEPVLVVGLPKSFHIALAGSCGGVLGLHQNLAFTGNLALGRRF